MATRLMFAAPALLEKLTSIYWYPHLISFDAQKKRWKLVTSQKKLVPFYFVNIFVIPVLGVGSIIIELIKHFVFHDKTVSTLVNFIFLTLGFLSFFSWGFNIPAIVFGKEMILYINGLLDFQHVLKPIRANKKVKVEEEKPTGAKEVFKEMVSDIKFLLAALETDKFGIFLNLTVVYFQILGFLLPLVGIIFNFDPIVHIMTNLGLKKLLPRVVFAILRYVICTLCVLETSRTVTLLLIGNLISYVVTFRLITLLRKRVVSEDTLRLYMNLRVIHRHGDYMLKYSVSVFLFLGFILCVVFNCFTVVGWRVFPIPFYLACMPITALIHFLIHVSIPLCVQCHEFSFDTIRNKWINDLTHGGDAAHSNFQRKLLRRLLKCMRSITFHSGSVATVDQATRLSYLDYISGETADVLMVFQSRIEKMHKISFTSFSFN